MFAPQRVAEADQGNADGNREQPLGELWQLRGGDGRNGADGEQHRRPPGENSRPEEGDAEDDPAGDVGEAGAIDEDAHLADVADRGAMGGHREHVVDIVGLTRRKDWEDEHADDLDAEDAEIAEAEDEVADQAEHSALPDLPQVDTGDADQRENGHEDLRRLADRVFGGRGERGVQQGVLDLHGDEQHAAGHRRNGGCSGECGGGNGHVRLPAV